MTAPTPTKITRTPSNHHLHKSGPNNEKIDSAEPLDIEYHKDVETSIEQMHEAGFVVFNRLLDDEGVKLLRERMERVGDEDSAYYNDWKYGHQSGHTGYNKQVGTPFCLDPDFLEYMDQPEVIDIIEDIHGKGARCIGGSVWITGPGRYPMGLHVDYQPFGLPEDIAMDPRVRVPIMVSTLHYYLNDVTPEMGPTILVAGSHRAGRAPDGDLEFNGQKPKALQCQAGDAMLFRSDLWHGALGNSSEERRYMLQVHYGSPYIKPSYEPIRNRISVPKPGESDAAFEKRNKRRHGRQVGEAILARANEKQRQLLGESRDDEPGSYVVKAYLTEKAAYFEQKEHCTKNCSSCECGDAQA